MKMKTCFLCNTTGKLNDFKNETFEKCTRMLLFRQKKNFKYNNIMLNGDTVHIHGYHLNCYKKFTVLHRKYRKEFENVERDDLIEHVDVGQIPTQCEDTDSSVDFLPESDEPPAKRSSTSATSVRQMETFCRLCLNQTTKNQMICLGNFHDLNYPSHSVQFKKNKILQTDMYLRLIRLLMPNFDHELVYNPVMCQLCSTKLQMASDFVEQCMASQKLIQQYKDTYCPSQGMVSCEDVVQNKPQIPSPNSSVPDVSQNVKKRKIAKSSPPVLVQQKKQQQPSKSYDIVTDMPKLIIKTEALDEFEPDDKFEVTSNDISNIKEEVEESCMYVATDDGDMSVTTEAVVKNEPSACKIKTPGLNPTDSSLGINVPDSKTGSKIISGECYNNVPVESFVTETY